MTPTVRPAVEDDLAAIAEIRVRSWQAAYRGMVPQGYLDAMRPEADADRRRARLAAAPTDDRRRDAMAEIDGVTAGWVAYGPYRDDDDDAPPGDPGEVFAIYVHPDHWRRGVGRALMRHAVCEMTSARMTPIVLWVLEANSRARRFYRSEGFRLDGGRHLFEVGGVRLPEVRYRYGGGRGDR